MIQHYDLTKLPSCVCLNSFCASVSPEGEALLSASVGGARRAAWAAEQGVHHGGKAEDDDEAVQLANRNLRGGGARRNHGARNAIVRTNSTTKTNFFTF